MQTAFVRNIPSSSLGKFLDLLKTFPSLVSVADFPEKVNAMNKMVFCKLPDASFSKFKDFIEKNFPGTEIQEGNKL